MASRAYQPVQPQSHHLRFVPQRPEGGFRALIKHLLKSRGLKGARLMGKGIVGKGYISGILSGAVNPPAPWVIQEWAKLLDYDATEMLKAAVVEKFPELLRQDLFSLVYAPSKSYRNKLRKKYELGLRVSHFGELLRHLRKEKRLTLAQLSRRCGSTKSHLSGVERVNVAPPLTKHAGRWAEVLGYPPHKMEMFGALQKTPPEIRDALFLAVYGEPYRGPATDRKSKWKLKRLQRRKVSRLRR